MRGLVWQEPRGRRLGAAFLVALACAFALLAVPARALAQTDYTYTVRVLTGNHGSIDGEVIHTVGSSYAYGAEVRLDRGWVTLEDGSKYYVKGFRISGQDSLCPEVLTITEDTDVVVAYGVRGAMVPYTVHFVEYGTGTPLANEEGQTSRTYEGKVGDKPVVAYDYIPGYRPLYRNITGTLQESGNDWTFEYVALAAGETPATPAAPGDAAATTPAATDAGATGADAAGADAAAATDAGAGATDEGETTPPPTEEILDLDTPLAGPSGEQAGVFAGINARLGWGPVHTVITIIALVLGIIAFFLMRRRKGEDDEQ